MARGSKSSESVNMQPRSKRVKNAPRTLESLLNEVERSMPLEERLNEIIDVELKKHFQHKEERKQRIMKELISASRIYEKMPLERLAIKVREDIDDVFDLLEEIILKNEFSGISVSGKELIFARVQHRAELDQKPVLLVSAAGPSNGSPVATLDASQFIHIEEDHNLPIERAHGDIIVDAELIPEASQLRLRLNIENSTDKTIQNLIIAVSTLGNLKFERMKPAYMTSGDWANQVVVQGIFPRSTRRVLLYFLPADCEPVSIAITLTYLNTEEQLVRSELIVSADLREPKFSKTTSIDGESLQDLLAGVLQFRGIRSFGIPAGVSDAVSFAILQEILETTGLKPVGNESIDYPDESNQHPCFYASTERNGNEQEIAVVAKVLNNKMDFFGLASDPMLLLCTLTMLANRLQTEFSSGTEMTGAASIVELTCLSCGATLSRFPGQGEVYECEFCGARMQF
jgi:predicted RNA-binding Zn-ribbon protein involved in translation (DUF1610 family)